MYFMCVCVGYTLCTYTYVELVWVCACVSYVYIIVCVSMYDIPSICYVCTIYVYVMCYYTCGDVGDMYGYVIVTGL